MMEGREKALFRSAKSQFRTLMEATHGEEWAQALESLNHTINKNELMPGPQWLLVSAMVGICQSNPFIQAMAEFNGEFDANA